MPYIDKDALIKAVEDLHDCYNGFSDTYDKACFIGLIEEQPTADVVSKEEYDMLFEHANILAEEMRKYQNTDVPERNVGKWIDDCECSICHWIHEDDKGFALLTNYNFCPNCGMGMKGGRG